MSKITRKISFVFIYFVMLQNVLFMYLSYSFCRSVACNIPGLIQYSTIYACRRRVHCCCTVVLPKDRIGYPVGAGGFPLPGLVGQLRCFKYNMTTSTAFTTSKNTTHLSGPAFFERSRACCNSSIPCSTLSSTCSML